MSDALDRRYDGKTVMVVDDDYDLLENLRVRLENVGFRVHTAETQADGETMIRDLDVDLAIFDLMMENQDSGFVLSHQLKLKAPEVPVILVTGVARETGIKFDSGTSEMRRWVKADVVMDKAIRWEQLGREIARLIKE